MSPELCVGCGTCATVCPTGALEARHTNDGELMRKGLLSLKANDGDAVFVCSGARREAEASGKHIDESAVVDVVCLSRIEETLAFSLVARGARRIVGVCGDCAACERSQGRASVELVQSTMEKIAQAWGLDARFDVVRDLPESACAQTAGSPEEGEGREEAVCEAFTSCTHAVDGLPLSRVAADTSNMQLQEGETVGFGEAGTIKMSFNPVHVQKDGTLPHFVPSRRLNLLDQLASLGDPVADEIDCRLWGHVVIDFDICQSCKMCAVFCPTGAICKYQDEHGIAGIEHYLAECVHCCLCQDVCPAKAIHCVTKVPTHQLAEGLTERYKMPDPEWMAGPDQILQRMRKKIGGNSVEHSY